MNWFKIDRERHAEAKTTGRGETALHMAAGFGYFEMSDLLCAHGATMNLTFSLACITANTTLLPQRKPC